MNVWSVVKKKWLQLFNSFTFNSTLFLMNAGDFDHLASFLWNSYYCFDQQNRSLWYSLACLAYHTAFISSGLTHSPNTHPWPQSVTAVFKSACRLAFNLISILAEYTAITLSVLFLMDFLKRLIELDYSCLSDLSTLTQYCAAISISRNSLK